MFPLTFVQFALRGAKLSLKHQTSWRVQATTFWMWAYVWVIWGNQNLVRCVCVCVCVCVFAFEQILCFSKFFNGYVQIDKDFIWPLKGFPPEDGLPSLSCGRNFQPSHIVERYYCFPVFFHDFSKVPQRNAKKFLNCCHKIELVTLSSIWTKTREKTLRVTNTTRKHGRANNRFFDGVQQVHCLHGI